MIRETTLRDLRPCQQSARSFDGTAHGSGPLLFSSHPLAHPRFLPYVVVREVQPHLRGQVQANLIAQNAVDFDVVLRHCLDTSGHVPLATLAVYAMSPSIGERKANQQIKLGVRKKDLTSLALLS